MPVIVAGGSGTRLWPLSRELYPKQFLSLDDDHSILQRTLVRLAGEAFCEPTVVSNEEYRFLILEQAEQIGRPLRQVVLEPEGRNTAPAMTVAALLAGNEDAVLLVTPADHHIADQDRFEACLACACDEAVGGRIVTLGVTPTGPETGYGYIRCARKEVNPGSGAGTGKGPAARDSRSGQRRRDLPTALPVSGFTEKPDASRATAYLDSGEYLWNSGMFVMKAGVWLRAIGRFRRDILDACTVAVETGRTDGSFFRVGEDAFLKCPAESIDYAVMEKAASDPEFECMVVPFDGGWSDIGSWKSVWELGQKDAASNCTIGNVTLHDTRDSLIVAQDRLVAALGLRGMVVVETPDAVLVADLDESQTLGDLVKRLKRKGRVEATVHRRVYRPWGSYENIVSSDAYQVKCLIVKPGRQLSLQMHHRRAEHWVIVSGIATVVCGEQTLTLRASESVYIPSGTRHRLGNQTGEPLEVIEVQTGSYFGEDDIVRFEDDFGRV